MLTSKVSGYSRREMIRIAATSVIGAPLATLLSGCGGGQAGASSSGNGGNGKTTTTGRQAVSVFANQQLVGTSNNQPVGPLMLITNVMDTDLNIEYWGVKDVNGVPTSIVEGAIWHTGSQQAVRSLFDAQQRLIELRDEVSGLDLQFTWTGSQQVSLSLTIPNTSNTLQSTITFQSGGYKIVKGSPSSRSVLSAHPRSRDIDPDDAGGPDGDDDDVVQDFTVNQDQGTYITSQVNGVGNLLAQMSLQDLNTIITASVLGFALNYGPLVQQLQSSIGASITNLQSSINSAYNSLPTAGKDIAHVVLDFGLEVSAQKAAEYAFAASNEEFALALGASLPEAVGIFLLIELMIGPGRRYLFPASNTNLINGTSRFAAIRSHMMAYKAH